MLFKSWHHSPIPSFWDRWKYSILLLLSIILILWLWVVIVSQHWAAFFLLYRECWNDVHQQRTAKQAGGCRRYHRSQSQGQLFSWFRQALLTVSSQSTAEGLDFLYFQFLVRFVKELIFRYTFGDCWYILTYDKSCWSTFNSKVNYNWWCPRKRF